MTAALPVKNYEGIIALGGDRASREQPVLVQPNIRSKIATIFLDYIQTVEGADNISEEATIYALINHPSFLDGPKVVQALSNEKTDLPVCSTTWMENFAKYYGVIVHGFIIRGEQNCYPIQKEESDLDTPRRKKHFEEVFCKVEEAGLLQEGAKMNAKVLQALIGFLNQGKANLILAATSIRNDVSSVLSSRALEIMEKTTVPIVPVSFQPKKGRWPTGITRFHRSITDRNDLENQLKESLNSSF